MNELFNNIKAAWARLGRAQRSILLVVAAALVVLTVVLQLALIYVPALNRVFDTAPLSAFEMGLCAACAVVVMAAVEAEKGFMRNGLLYRSRR